MTNLNVNHPLLKGGIAAVFLLTSAALPATPTAFSQTGQAKSTPSIEQDALRAAASDPDTKQFYERNGWSPVWTDAATQALRQALDQRSAHGLERLSFLQEDSGSANTAEREAARTAAALRYAAALARGVTDPANLHDVYTLPRPTADLAGPLADAVAQGRLADWFASLAPQDDAYATLSESYRSFAQRADSSGGAGRIESTGLIQVGDTDDRVPAIVEQLKATDYLSGGGAAAEGKRYTQALADAVTRLQHDHGIDDDGVVGPDTLGVLNSQPGDRARALAVALERRRWQSRNPPGTRIDVNVAAARLHYFRDGREVDRRRVIVGKPGHETPPLMAPIYRLVANPTWTVPKSIENGELSNVGAGYLESHNMVRRNGYLVQQPGPDNALGLVKFDMQDDQAIYLHDTGSPALFDRSQRHLSHGCVRVDDALEFAMMIAQDEGIADQWQKAHAASDQTFVDLPRKIPVRLLYENAFVDDNGEVAFRTDPYGWNAPIAEALGFSESSNTTVQAEPIDIGP